MSEEASEGIRTSIATYYVPTLDEYAKTKLGLTDEYDYATSIRDGEARVLDSIDELASTSKLDVPCLRIAAKKFRSKLPNGLARLYQHVDDPASLNDQQVLLDIKGGAFVHTSNKGRESAAYCNRAGIHFNSYLVIACDEYVAERELNSDQAILDDEQGAAYVALFETAITHEFGHLKLHHDRENPKKPEKWKLTQEMEPNRIDPFPIYSEAGYSIEARIRKEVFNEKDPDALEEFQDPGVNRRHSGRLQKSNIPNESFIHLLYAESASKKKRGARNPFKNLRLRKVRYSPSRGVTYEVPDGAPQYMSLAEIQAFMSYFVDANNVDADDDDDDDDSGGDDADGSDEDGGGSGGKGDTDRGGNGPGEDKKDKDRDVSCASGEGQGGSTKKRKHSGSGAGGSTNRQNRSNNAWAQGSRKTHEKNESKHPRGPPRDPANFNPNCKVKLRTCDKHGKQKNKFSPTEDMYVEVTATNDGVKSCHIKMRKGGVAFGGRGGHIIKILNETGYYTPSESYQDYEVIEIAPGQEWTFTTKFAIGMLQKDRGWCSVHTPEKVGDYTIGFYYPSDMETCLGKAEISITEVDMSKLEYNYLLGYYTYK